MNDPTKDVTLIEPGQGYGALGPILGPIMEKKKKDDAAQKAKAQQFGQPPAVPGFAAGTAMVAPLPDANATRAAFFANAGINQPQGVVPQSRGLDAVLASAVPTLPAFNFADERPMAPPPPAPVVAQNQGQGPTREAAAAMPPQAGPDGDYDMFMSAMRGMSRGEVMQLLANAPMFKPRDPAQDVRRRMVRALQTRFAVDQQNPKMDPALALSRLITGYGTVLSPGTTLAAQTFANAQDAGLEG